jgi:hypothetical protein
MNARRRAGVLAAAFLSVLTACGGGGGSSRAQPLLQQVEPRLAAANTPIHVVITGQGFGGVAATPEVAPTLTLERMRDVAGNAVSGPSDSALVPVTTQGGVERVEVDVTFPGDAPPGVYRFRLTRRDGAAGAFADALALLPAPRPLGLDASAVCALTPSAAVTVVGEDLLVADGAAPRLSLDNGLPAFDPRAFRATLDAVPSGCAPFPFARADLSLCTRLTAPLPAATPAQVFQVAVLSSAPVDRLTTQPLPLLVDRGLGHVSLPGLRSALDAPVSLQIGGGPLATTPFIHVPSGGAPVASLAGSAVPVTVDGCQASGAPGQDLCASLTVTIPQGFEPGDHLLSLSTMPGCDGDAAFSLAARPSVTAVAPAVACLAGQGPLQIAGANFLDPHVFLDGHELVLTRTCPPGQGACGQISAILFGFPEPPGVYPLIVTTQSVPPASSLEPVSVRVAPGPPIGEIPAPQTIFGGVDRPVSLAYTAPATTITSVVLAPLVGGSPVIPVVFTQVAQGVDLVVPAGTAAGWYDVISTEGGLCSRGAWQPVMVVGDFRVLAEDYAAGPGDRVPTIESKDRRLATDPTVVAAWQASGGNPGGALSHTFDTTEPTWWFAFSTLGGWSGFDLAVLHFDLRLAAAGSAPVTAPDVRLRGNFLELQYTLPVQPDATWQTFSVPLDDPTGWTIHDDLGTRPASAADLRRGIDGAVAMWIRGRHADGAGETWIDNVAVELHH